MPPITAGTSPVRRRLTIVLIISSVVCVLAILAVVTLRPAVVRQAVVDERPPAGAVASRSQQPDRSPADDASPGPVGQGDGWEMRFSDEFDGASLDNARWDDRSSAEADGGRGNKGNKQLEWNRAANCAVAGGELTMTAKRERVTSGSSGERYDWTSCLISSTPAYAFQYGYIEERAVLPTQRGFWPAFWTWQAQNVNRPVETDVYEYYTARSDVLEMTQHSGASGACTFRLPFDPAADWHVYGVAIEPSGTTWYVDGKEVCRTAATSDGTANIISNLAVDAANPPASDTRSVVKRVDYIRAWQRR